MIKVVRADFPVPPDKRFSPTAESLNYGPAKYLNEGTRGLSMVLRMKSWVGPPAAAARIMSQGPGPISPVNPHYSNLQPSDSLKLKLPSMNNRLADERAGNIRIRTASFMAKQCGYKPATDREADRF